MFVFRRLRFTHEIVAEEKKSEELYMSMDGLLFCGEIPVNPG